MNKPNFSKYKFHASGIKKLMVNSRKKSDPLSETTKSYLREIWIEAVFGRIKPIITPAMQKGTIVETDSMELVQKVTGQTYFKNNKELENDYIIGTPDIIDKKNSLIRDIKSSWDLWTFAKVTEKSASKDYYWQILGYMWLTDTKKGSLNYALVNTPENLINDEIYRLCFKMTEEEADKHRINFIFDDIDEKLRLKQYNFDFKQEDVEQVMSKIELCREYLISYKL